MDCSLPGSSVHGIFQARVLEWVAISSPEDLPNPGIEPGSPSLEVDALTSNPQGSPEMKMKPMYMLPKRDNFRAKDTESEGVQNNYSMKTKIKRNQQLSWIKETIPHKPYFYPLDRKSVV